MAVTPERLQDIREIIEAHPSGEFYINEPGMIFSSRTLVPDLIREVETCRQALDDKERTIEGLREEIIDRGIVIATFRDDLTSAYKRLHELELRLARHEGAGYLDEEALLNARNKMRSQGLETPDGDYVKP